MARGEGAGSAGTKSGEKRGNKTAAALVGAAVDAAQPPNPRAPPPPRPGRQAARAQRHRTGRGGGGRAPAQLDTVRGARPPRRATPSLITAFSFFSPLRGSSLYFSAASPRPLRACGAWAGRHTLAGRAGRATPTHARTHEKREAEKRGARCALGWLPRGRRAAHAMAARPPHARRKMATAWKSAAWLAMAGSDTPATPPGPRSPSGVQSDTAVRGGVGRGRAGLMPAAISMILPACKVLQGGAEIRVFHHTDWWLAVPPGICHSK